MVKAEYKDRSLTVYFSSSRTLEDLKRRADEQALSTSEFIESLLSNSVVSSEVDDLRDQIKTLAARDDETGRLRSQIKKLEDKIAKMQHDAKQREHDEIIAEEGVAEEMSFNRYNVVKLLKKGGTWSSKNILDELNSGQPFRITNAMYVGRVISELADSELIEETTLGWRWVG